MSYEQGVKTVRLRLDFSTQELADACGVSRRTVEGWEQGRTPTAAALNMMSKLISDSHRIA